MEDLLIVGKGFRGFQSFHLVMTKNSKGKTEKKIESAFDFKHKRCNQTIELLFSLHCFPSEQKYLKIYL